MDSYIPFDQLAQSDEMNQLEDFFFLEGPNIKAEDPENPFSWPGFPEGPLFLESHDNNANGSFQNSNDVSNGGISSNAAAVPTIAPGGPLDNFTQVPSQSANCLQYQQPLPQFRPEEILAGFQYSPMSDVPTDDPLLANSWGWMEQQVEELGQKARQGDPWACKFLSFIQEPSAPPQSVFGPVPAAFPGDLPTPAMTPFIENSPGHAASQRVASSQQCGQCSFRTGNRDEFRRHEESVHKHIRRHHCDVCDVNLNDPSGLSKHMRSARHKARARQLGRHPGALSRKRYGCKFCFRGQGIRKAYARSDQLKRHLKTCRHCVRLPPQDLPDGYVAGAGGMDDGLLRDGPEYEFERP